MALFLLLWENSAAPAAGSFAHGGKGTKAPFWGGAPSARILNRRAKFEWRALLLPGHWARFLERKLSKELCAKLRFASSGTAWPVPCCSAGHGRWAAKNHSCNETPIPCVGAAFRRPPHPDQPLWLLVTGALSWSSRTASRKPSGQRQRRRTEGNPITARPGAPLVPFWANRKEHPRSRKAPRTPTF